MLSSHQYFGQYTEQLQYDQCMLKEESSTKKGQINKYGSKEYPNVTLRPEHLLLPSKKEVFFHFFIIHLTCKYVTHIY